MSWGFEVGRVYNRRTDIHSKYAGQQQGGIITPAEHALVFIITGEEGLEHGYADRHRPDGVFEYFGEGQVGDMVMQKGNRAIAEHSVAGKSLLLFQKTNAGLRFEGEMVYEAHHIERALDRNGADRDAIVFELRPLEAINESVELVATPVEVSLDALRETAMAAATNEVTKTATSQRNVYKRSEDVRNYVLARAKGHCQGCSVPAPFFRLDGSPYLEPHHLRRISDGGPDHPAFVIALCPNCHRRVHAGADGAKYNSSLLELMKTIEPAR
jgi:5-methylcytosine-specific restriction protein A